MADFKITVLGGDGIGPEVVEQAMRVLHFFTDSGFFSAQFINADMGGDAIDRWGQALPMETERHCLKSDAVVLGAVGHPRFDDESPGRRPESGLLALRKALQTSINIRPARFYPQLIEASPLKKSVVQDADFVIVRELNSGIYYGEPRGIVEGTKSHYGFNTMRYDSKTVEKIARFAFELASNRRKHLTSVDKANVLEVSKLWRDTVSNLSSDYPDVTLEHRYVDCCAMELCTKPGSFDVIVTGNMFGDILSDQAAALTGSLGMLPSASLGKYSDLYEPVHGSAPDIAGQNRANPLGAILSVALMLRHSLGKPKLAEAVEQAVENCLWKRAYTTDLIFDQSQKPLSTTEMGDAVVEQLERVLSGCVGSPGS
jgi:3-isopropylmalate dehydrogenase